MKIFDHPNLDNFKCPICGTTDDKPVAILIKIDGTQKDRTIQARQYHIECIDLIEMKFDYTGFHDTPTRSVISMVYSEK